MPSNSIEMIGTLRRVASKWEYNTIDITVPGGTEGEEWFIKRLNIWGKEGWEVVTAVTITEDGLPKPVLLVKRKRR